jgi:hypothetical protein
MTQAQNTAKEKFKKAIEYRKKTGVSLKEAFAYVYGKKVGAIKKAPLKKSSTDNSKDSKSHNVNIKIVSGIGNIENATYKILGLKIGFKKEIDKETGLYIIQVLDLSNNKKIIPISNNSDSKEIAYDLTEYIKYYTNTPSNVESYGVRRKLEKLIPNIKKEVQKLNKSVKKLPAKKVAVKKPLVKKVARQSRSTKKVKATYKVNYQTGTSKRTDRGKNQDAKRKALAPGKRTSASGNTYYETRANRSDISRSAMTGIEDKMFKDLYNVREKIANTKQAILKLQGYKNDVPPSQRYQYTLKIKQYKKYLVELNTHYRELKKYI